MKKFLIIFLVVISPICFAIDYPNQKEGVWIAKDFQFHTGEVLKEVKLGYINSR